MPEEKQTTPEAESTPPAEEVKEKGGKDTVPYGRFKEVNDENKSLKAKLAEFESEKAKAEAERKQQEEAEALKKGEHEKIIAQKQAELDAYSSKEETWAKRTASIQAMVDVKYQEIQSSYGEEILTKAKELIGSEDPRVVLEKLDKVLALVGVARPKGGQEHTP